MGLSRRRWKPGNFSTLIDTPDGAKDILGQWIETSKGAKFWLRVMNELKNRGVGDILIAVVDGLYWIVADTLRAWVSDPESITLLEPRSALPYERGELVVACDRPLANQRAYYFVQPEGQDNPPATRIFLDWLVQIT